MASPMSLQPLIGALRSSSCSRVAVSSRYACRNARIRNTRYFSRSLPHEVNLARPTSRTASTATATKSTNATSSTPPPTKAASPSPATSPSSSPTPSTAPSSNSNHSTPSIRSLTEGFSDASPLPEPDSTPGPGTTVDWTRSFHGMSSEPFSDRATDILLAPLDPQDVEIKPDGIVYLPEIKYRRILNRAFGPGGWGLAPRGETIVTGRLVTREYGLVVHGRLVSLARGEQQYFDPEGIPTATEGCKSNALMRCCKDLGIASELWDPVFIRKFKSENAKEVWVEHLSSKRKKKVFMRKDVQVAPGGFKLV